MIELFPYYGAGHQQQTRPWIDDYLFDEGTMSYLGEDVMLPSP